MKRSSYNWLFVVAVAFSLFIGGTVFAEVTGSNIADKQDELESLEQQIAESQRELNQISTEKQSLAHELALATATLQSIAKQQKLTSYKIAKTEKNIRALEEKITQLEKGISSNAFIVAGLIRNMNQMDNASFAEALFSPHSTFSDVAQTAHQITIVQKRVRSISNTMRIDQDDAAAQKEELIKERANLASFQNELRDKERIAESEKKSRDELLRATKNKEASYQTYLADLQARKQKLDDEIRNYEASLKFTLDLKSLPKAARGVLGWPLDDVVITQQFGKTVDAKRLYVSKSHSGVDFRAAIGTAVYAVADGVVEGTGDTDQTCYRASFGKWVFIRHDNGLATAYGHLSLIKATEGQRVHRGDLIAYSGNTGHTTGPHLHLTVYASHGVDGGEGARVTERPSESCKGAIYRMPLAPTSAYLDPLRYLPGTTASMFKDQKLD